MLFTNVRMERLYEENYPTDVEIDGAEQLVMKALLPIGVPEDFPFSFPYESQDVY